MPTILPEPAADPDFTPDERRLYVLGTRVIWSAVAGSAAVWVAAIGALWCFS